MPPGSQHVNKCSSSFGQGMVPSPPLTVVSRYVYHTLPITNKCFLHVDGRDKAQAVKIGLARAQDLASHREGLGVSPD